MLTKKNRHLISLHDLSKDEINGILQLATEMKNDSQHSRKMLVHKTIGLVFQKPSNRTRVSFEVGVFQMGGNCIYLGPEEINLGVRESTTDVAKTLSRYLDGIVARTYDHQDVLTLAENSSVNVINGLSDLHHPCQALTDLFSIREKKGDLEGKIVAYIGDGNNVCHSLMLGCAMTGTHIRVASPAGYTPDPSVVEEAKRIGAKSGAKVEVCDRPETAAMGADVLYADVWTSMGQEEEYQKRLKDFEGYQINRALAECAKKDFIFMHCLPAHRDEEVTADIIDGKHSIVFDQAENRLHVQKAILNFFYNTW